MSDRLTVTIAHRLPGRLRLRLSHEPKDPPSLLRSVREHPGISAIRYTAITRSLLLESDPRAVQPEEIVIRVGLAMSLEYDCVPIVAYSQEDTGELSGAAALSGLGLAVAFAARLIGPSTAARSWVDRSAAIGTLWATLGHGWAEIRRRGVYDPEVMSVFFLLAAMLRGSALPAALITWASTFGRHLIQRPRTGVEIRPLPRIRGGRRRYLEVAISPIQAEPDGMPALRALPSLLWFVLTGDSSNQPAGLIDEMKTVSRHHHRVLEGLGDLREGIPLRVG